MRDNGTLGHHIQQLSISLLSLTWLRSYSPFSLGDETPDTAYAVMSSIGNGRKMRWSLAQLYWYPVLWTLLLPSSLRIMDNRAWVDYGNIYHLQSRYYFDFMLDCHDVSFSICFLDLCKDQCLWGGTLLAYIPYLSCLMSPITIDCRFWPFDFWFSDPFDWIFWSWYVQTSAPPQYSPIRTAWPHGVCCHVAHLF